MHCVEIHLLRTEAEYKAALKIVSPWFDNEPAQGSEDAQRFDILVSLIEAYEAEHYPIDL